MMTRCTPAIDTGVGSNSCRKTFVTKQLSDSFKAARLGIKQDFRAQMAKLMRREQDACAFQVDRDQPADRLLAFWSTVGIHE